MEGSPPSASRLTALACSAADKAWHRAPLCADRTLIAAAARARHQQCTQCLARTSISTQHPARTRHPARSTRARALGTQHVSTQHVRYLLSSPCLQSTSSPSARTPTTSRSAWARPSRTMSPRASCRALRPDARRDGQQRHTRGARARSRGGARRAGRRLAGEPGLPDRHLRDVAGAGAADRRADPRQPPVGDRPAALGRPASRSHRGLHAGHLGRLQQRAPPLRGGRRGVAGRLARALLHQHAGERRLSWTSRSSTR